MLPLGAFSIGSLLSGCASTAATGTNSAASSIAFASAAFTAMPAPSLANPAAMATTTVASSLQLSLQDGSTHAYKLAYQPFFITGDRVPDGNGGTVLAGGYVDIVKRPIIDKSVPGKERQFFSDCPDGTSLLKLEHPKVAGIKGKAVFAVVQFEYANADQGGADTYGTLPSPIAVLTLDQNQATGALTLVKYHSVDTSEAQGLWITCGSSLSPWNTHLSSEEYEPDAPFVSENKQFKAFSKNLFGDENVANSYHYGHLPEVTVNPDGTGTIVKHYCMGRISHELIQVMPDNRTALMGDDATNGGLFIMEKAAAFLETHRYAYLMGGSMGFSKMEGTTVNIKDKVAYSALQNIQDSMVKTGKGWNAASGIALDKALVAGGVMALPMTGGQVDQAGATIKSEWVPVVTRALLMGEDIAADALGNLANPDKVSNPDNLKFSEKLRTLFIGEDSGTHVNNFVWAYNVDTRQLSRLMSMPSGAEATGLGVVDDLNGWMYITSNFQHPGDWNAKLHGKVQATLDPLVRANYKDRFGAAVGYLTADTGGIKLG